MRKCFDIHHTGKNRTNVSAICLSFGTDMMALHPNQVLNAYNNMKYRNPDTPVGYTCNVKPEVKYEEGDVIDGVHCLFMGLIIESGLFDDDTDNSGLSDLDLSEDEDVLEILDELEEPPEVVCEKVIKKEKIEEDEEEKEEKSSEEKDEVTITSEKPGNVKKEESSKKNKKVKRVHSDDSDDDSDRSSSRSRKYRKSSRRNSRSPSIPRSYETTSIKEEPKEPPEHLYGSYPCDICHSTMTSLLTYQTHINGKKHLKNLKARNVCKTVAKTIPAAPTEATSKYPQPPPGVRRSKVNVMAEIQQLIEKQVKTPLPGLKHVIEIQGVTEVQYYCSLCDSVCSPNSIIPHLTGFKHQMNSLRHFAPSTYERMASKAKYQIDKQVLYILSDIERQEGIGKMTVVRDVLTKFTPNSPEQNVVDLPSTSQSLPSTSSSKRPGAVSLDHYQKAAIPDTSNSDFYCKVCESHMNSEAMWQSHIHGRRHIKNMNKMPGALPSKTKTVQIHNAQASLLKKLEDIHEPIVGLNQIQETQVPETQTKTYTCFLCGACLTSVNIIDHLLTLKHRTKYLEHINYPNLEILVGMREPCSYTLVEEMCAEVESREGRGLPKVHVSKSGL